jgi:hypothetical protein
MQSCDKRRKRQPYSERQFCFVNGFPCRVRIITNPSTEPLEPGIAEHSKKNENDYDGCGCVYDDPGAALYYFGKSR